MHSMRIDAHQHFWRYDPRAYPWIGAGMEVLGADYLPGDLVPLLDEGGLDASVAVQARPNLDETTFLLELAAREPRIAGVVGWIDLCADGVDEQLARFDGQGALRGLRHLVQDEPDDAFLLREDFGAGLARLGERGLAYDLLLFPRHLPYATRLLERHPEQTFVLDHLAKPAIRSGPADPAFATWARDLAALAEHPRCFCKLSGLVTEADWQHWTPDDLVPYLDVAFEAFGPERVLYGSDWPVCLLAGSYARVLAALRSWSAQLEATARDNLFGANAARAYALGDSLS